MHLECNRSKSTDTAQVILVNVMEIGCERVKKYVWRSHSHYKNEKSSLLSSSALCYNYLSSSSF